jgi:hypothetical protein
MIRFRKLEGQNEVAAPMLPLVQKNSSLPARIIVYLSLIILFNVEIRSIGQLGVVPDIGIIPKFWLSDIGLLLPLIWVKIKNIKLVNGPMLIAIFLISFYGLIIAVIRNNPFYYIGQDLRTILAFFSGFATILMIKGMRNALKVVINMELILSLAATATIIFLPGVGRASVFERLTHPGAFIMSTMPLIIFSTAIIFAKISNIKALILKSWLCGLILLIDAAILTQTRSMFIAVSFGIVLAIVSSYATRESYHIHKRPYLAFNNVILIGFVITIGIIFHIQAPNLKNFIVRLESGTHYYNDVGMKVRLEEIPAAIGKMTVQDHIFGMGLNPVSELMDFRGFNYNIVHIGILNIWWRFGILIFITVNLLIIRTLVSWINTLLRTKKRLDQRIKRVTILICTPSLIVAYIISLTSGGWSSSFTYGLGIAYGIYTKVRREVFLEKN